MSWRWSISYSQVPAIHAVDDVFPILAKWISSFHRVWSVHCDIGRNPAKVRLGDEHSASFKEEQGMSVLQSSLLILYHAYTNFLSCVLCNILFAYSCHINTKWSVPWSYFTSSFLCPELNPTPWCDPVPLSLLAERGSSPCWLFAEDDGRSGEQAERGYGKQGTSNGHVRVSTCTMCVCVCACVN